MHAIPELADDVGEYPGWPRGHDIELVYDVLADAWVVERYSDAGRAHGTVWRVCEEGLLTLGRSGPAGRRARGHDRDTGGGI
jgi:hypothetical protein